MTKKWSGELDVIVEVVNKIDEGLGELSIIRIVVIYSLTELMSFKTHWMPIFFIVVVGERKHKIHPILM